MADIEYRKDTLCINKLYIGRTNESYAVDNNEWIDVTIDSNNRIIEGIKQNGLNVIPLLQSNTSYINELNLDQLNLSDFGKIKLKDDLWIDFIDTNQKMQEFALLFSNVTGDIETFIFFSDPHWFINYDKCEMKDKALDHLHNMKNIFDNTPTDFVICCGDWLVAHKQSIAIKDLAWIDGYMNNLFSEKYYPVCGNHDNNHQGELDETTDTSANDGELTNQQMVNLWFRKFGSMYYSFKGSNTKFYVFHSGIDWVSTMNDYRWEQIDWFAEQLLSNEDVHIVLAMHITKNDGNYVEFATNIAKISKAFNNRSSVDLNNKTYDFSNLSTGTIHCILCGHEHSDWTDMLETIPVYCITTASDDGNFDMILIDYNQSKLKSIRVGVGENREMNIINNN